MRLSGWDVEDLTEALLAVVHEWPYVDTAFPRNNNRVKGGTVEEDLRVDFLELFDHIALPGDGRVFLIQSKSNPQDALDWREELEEAARENPFGVNDHLVIEGWLYRRERPGYDTWRWNGDGWDFLSPWPEGEVNLISDPGAILDLADTSLDGAKAG